MSKIRTLDKAIKELKENDPKCDLTLSALRKKVINNEIPYSRCGNKYLIDIDTLPQTLFNTDNTNLKKGNDNYEIN